MLTAPMVCACERGAQACKDMRECVHMMTDLGHIRVMVVPYRTPPIVPVTMVFLYKFD